MTRKAKAIYYGVGTICGILLLLMALMPGKSNGAYAEEYGYGGNRWRGTTICVHNKVDNRMVRQAVYDAVKNIRDTTNLHVINMGKTTCKGYSQVVTVVDNSYADSRMSWVRWNGHDWAYTPNKRYATWITRSGVEVRINTRYLKKYPNTSTWRHIAIHELGHVVGLGHRTDTCYSVETMKEKCGQKPSALQSVDRKLINTIYGW